MGIHSRQTKQRRRRNVACTRSCGTGHSAARHPTDDCRLPTGEFHQKSVGGLMGVFITFGPTLIFVFYRRVYNLGRKSWWSSLGTLCGARLGWLWEDIPKRCRKNGQNGISYFFVFCNSSAIFTALLQVFPPRLSVTVDLLLSFPLLILTTFLLVCTRRLRRYAELRPPCEQGV